MKYYRQVARSEFDRQTQNRRWSDNSSPDPRALSETSKPSRPIAAKFADRQHNLEVAAARTDLRQRRRRIGLAFISTLMEVLLIGLLLWGVITLVRAVAKTSNAYSTDDSVKRTDPVVRLRKPSGHALLAQLGFPEIVSVDLSTLATRSVYRSTDRPIRTFHVSQDGATLLVNLDDQEILIFRNNDLLLADPLEAGMEVSSVLSADGSACVILLNGKSVRYWNLTNSDPELAEFELLEIADTISVDPTGDRLAASTKTARLDLYDVTTGTHLQTLTHLEPMKGIHAWSDDGRWLAVSCSVALTMFDMQANHFAWRVPTGPDHNLQNIAISADSRLVAVASYQSGIQILDCSTGELRNRFSPDYFVHTMAFSPDGDTLCLCGANFSTIRVWSISTGRELNPIELN